jgi:flavin-dependent dehydrogenase
MSTRTDPYDAVVVGARPAGAATAMLLARAGLRVLLVDRSRQGADALSTHALMRGGVLQLARWGLLDEVASCTPAVRRGTFHYGDRRVDVPIRPDAYVPALYSPRRTVLDPIVVDAARAAGADVRFGMTVTDVRRDGAGRVVGIAGRDGAGEPFEAPGGVVIGADGMMSTIARLVGAPARQTADHTSAMIYGYWDDLPVAGSDLYYRPGVTAGCFPTNGGQTCVFVGTTPRRFRSELRSGTAAAYRRLLAAAAPELGSARGLTPSRLRVFAGRKGYVRQPHGPGWALVGDAGYFKDPMTSHGITDAFRDAELVARAVVAAASGEMALDAALAEYEATRDALSADLFAVADALASFRWDIAEVQSLMLRLSVATQAEVAWLTDLDAMGAAA